MAHLNRKYVKRISIWGRLVGILTILSGIGFIVFGFLTYWVFILSGLVSIGIGIMLFNIGQEAKRVYRSQEETISSAATLIRQYGRFLLLLIILAVISIIFHAVFWSYTY